MKFRKKPVVIEAWKFTGDNGMEISIEDPCDITPTCTGTLLIHTLEGTMTALPGDWIIRGVKGEFYPCKPDIFEMTYEPVEDGK